MQTWQNFLNQYPMSHSKNSDGIMDLSHLGLLKITGEDAKKFLQGQLTCNIEEISSTQSRLGAHCNPKGRIIFLFLLFYFQNNYYLQMPHEMIPIAIQSLKKYAVFFKVQLHDASGELISIGYSAENLNQFTHPLPENQDETIQTNDLLIIKILGKKTRYMLCGKIETLSPLWKKMISETPYISSDHWKCLDIEAGLANIYPETSENFLPHELNLHIFNAISFDKGCYTGQEIIARMHYRGKLKNQLQHIMIESATLPLRGSDLENTHNPIVDFCKKGKSHYELLIIN
jgi:folate-binding protein YgfZ